MPTNPCPDKRGQVPAFSRTTATQCVYQAPLQQNPVQYARRPTCGKNRDRFRVKKPLHHYSHTLGISSSFTAKSCAVCSSTGLREKSGSVPLEETILFVLKADKSQSQHSATYICSRGVNVAAIAAKKSCFPCVVSAAEKMPTSLVLLLLPSLDMRGKIPTYSRATANRMPNVLCVLHKRIHQRPRIHPSRNHYSHTLGISSSFATAKSCAACSSTGLREKSGSVPLEETILFVNVAAIAAKMFCFPCVVSAAKKIGNGSVYSNELCVPGKPISPNFLRKTYAAKAARIQQLRE